MSLKNFYNFRSNEKFIIILKKKESLYMYVYKGKLIKSNNLI